MIRFASVMPLRGQTGRFARIVESRMEYTGKILITRMPYYETLPLPSEAGPSPGRLVPYKMIVTPTHIQTEYIILPNSHAPASQIYDIYQNHPKEKNGLHK